jgi:DHA1 family bicyclomycin/chloramphenicol resistance-like MFS transporter
MCFYSCPFGGFLILYSEIISIMINSFKTGLLLSYICIASLSAAIITPALPHIQSFFNLPNGAVEWVVSIFLLGYVIGQLIYAPIANRFGRLTALRAGLIINLLGILICLLSTSAKSFPLLLAGRLITALGAASGLTCTFMLLNELLPKDRVKQAMSLAVVSFTLGIGLAVLAGGLITQYFQWQDCFIALLIHGILMLMLTWQFQETLKEVKPIHPAIIFKNYCTAFLNKNLIIFALVAGFVSFIAYGYSAFAPIYSQSGLHLTASQFGYWNSLNMIGMLLSGILSAYLMKRYPIERVLITGFSGILLGLSTLTIITIFSIHNSAIFFSTTSFLYLTSGLLFPAASFLGSTSIEDRASASSVMSFINMGSAMLGVIVMGYLPFYSITSFTMIMWLFFMMVILLCLRFTANKKLIYVSK